VLVNAGNTAGVTSATIGANDFQRLTNACATVAAGTSCNLDAS
jgi:hypothetical protein